jgi:hypothetical protein
LFSGHGTQRGKQKSFSLREKDGRTKNNVIQPAGAAGNRRPCAFKELFMDFTQNSCREFVEVLASSAPVPGGGGASALVAAIGTALGNMVGSLTVGKKKYADVEAEIVDAQGQMRRAPDGASRPGARRRRGL